MALQIVQKIAFSEMKSVEPVVGQNKYDSDYV